MYRYLPPALGQLLILALAMVIAVIALRFWRYWSMRFWLAAAFLHWLVPFGYRALDMNGPQDRRLPPMVLMSSFYLLADFSEGLIIVLMALGLLSFHPSARWIDTARYRNTVVTAVCFGAISVLLFFGWKRSRPRVIEPLNPMAQHEPSRPLATALTASLEPLQTVFNDTAPKFRLTLTNHSDADIHLNGLQVGRFKFRFEPRIHMRRADGRDSSWSTELKVPRDDEVLAAGASRTFAFPDFWWGRDREPSLTDELFPTTHSIGNYATPGDYTAYIAFWLEENKQFQRVLTNVVHFRWQVTKPSMAPNE